MAEGELRRVNRSWVEEGKENGWEGKEISSKREGEEREGEREKRGVFKAFWNVAGLLNKDKEFWRDLEEWDVICLCET